MEYVKIISDSTCDLSGELIDRYDISILPLHVLLGEKEYKDGVDITPEDIYRWSDENNTTPKTSRAVYGRGDGTDAPLCGSRQRGCLLQYFRFYVQLRQCHASGGHRNWRQSIW